MRVHILFDFQRGRGGGSHFLGALREQWRGLGVYTESIWLADVIIINSHNRWLAALLWRLLRPRAVFVHRIDGPMSVYTERDDRRDHRVRLLNRFVANATIFQSRWSQRENHGLGLILKHPEQVIGNAPDSTIFNREAKVAPRPQGKVRLIASSLSTNQNKGFATLTWLDAHLDWDSYAMKLVGTSPVPFTNIEVVAPASPEDVSRHLKQADIYLFPSRFEACSNALLEALHCGLPAIAYDGSSNPEVLGQGGKLFTEDSEIPELLEKILQSYERYQQAISVLTIAEVAEHYYAFAEQVSRRSR